MKVNGKSNFDDEIDENDNAESRSSNLSIRDTWKLNHGKVPGKNMYDYYEEITSCDSMLVILNDLK